MVVNPREEKGILSDPKQPTVNTMCTNQGMFGNATALITHFEKFVASTSMQLKSQLRLENKLRLKTI